MSNPGLQFVDQKRIFSAIDWESYTYTSGATTDTYQFFLAGQLYLTVTITYTDGTKTTEVGATKVFA